MTIAAGFFHRDGVLLAVDTEATSLTAKTRVQKIKDISGDWGKAIVGFSGPINTSKAPIQFIRRSLRARLEAM